MGPGHVQTAACKLQSLAVLPGRHRASLASRHPPVGILVGFSMGSSSHGGGPDACRGSGCCSGSHCGFDSELRGGSVPGASGAGRRTRCREWRADERQSIVALGRVCRDGQSLCRRHPRRSRYQHEVRAGQRGAGGVCVDRSHHTQRGLRGFVGPARHGVAWPRHRARAAWPWPPCARRRDPPSQRCGCGGPRGAGGAGR
mmetsp:Transcript_67400/g.171073  ORF Transcript_67400/g.171073 Transcript_67400/m.171073 type:complete len:200 (-) Transcript_67400:760-1359(-)